MRTQRSCFAAITAVLLLFPLAILLPSHLTSAGLTGPGVVLGPLSSAAGNAEREYPEPRTTHFSPAPSLDDGISYVARRGIDTIAYFGLSEVHYSCSDSLVKLDFPSSSKVAPVGEEPLGSTTNYMYGSDPANWRTGLKDCAVLRYADIYPGIDLVYRFLDGNLKYEFIVGPHADPSQIRLRYPDADVVSVDSSSVRVTRLGSVLVDGGLKVVQQEAAIGCAFYLDEANTIGLEFASYDTSCPLTIDPVILVYSTFLGGSGNDQPSAIAVEDGYIYIMGSTNSGDFPTVNSYDPSYGGSDDCFVTKLAADGQSLVYSTFIGGSGYDDGEDIAVENGFVYITGYTTSSNFPAVNAYSSFFNGGYDCFVTKLATDGQSLVYSTFLGGTSGDFGHGIAVKNGSVYVTGYTQSSGFPTINAYNSTLNGGSDCFVAQFAADGLSLVYSTLLGGTSFDIGYGIAIENGSAYVTGYTHSSDFPTVNANDSSYNGMYDCFVTKLATDGQSLVYSTFLGGSQDETGVAIAVENGHAYVTGSTRSGGFPTVNAYDYSIRGEEDCFITELGVDGLSLVYSTFLGGSANDAAADIAVEYGFAYVTGYTYSSDFPAVDAADPTHNGGYDCFVTKFAVSGELLIYSTFLGGSGYDDGFAISVEGGHAYVTGWTNSGDFPAVAAYDSTLGALGDCFVAIVSEHEETGTTTTQSTTVPTIDIGLPFIAEAAVYVGIVAVLIVLIRRAGAEQTRESFG